MRRTIYSNKNGFLRRIGLLVIVILSTVFPKTVWGQEQKKSTAVDELVEMGFENVRCSENDSERIYTIENNVYRLQGVGIGKAIDVIQSIGMPEKGKTCKVIITRMDIPQLSLTYSPNPNDTIGRDVERSDWKASYELKDSWKEVKKEKKKNSSSLKVDILVYPQLSFMNLIITQIYQVLFTFNPAIEVTLWKGAKISGQIKVPVYNDGYGSLEDKVHPGHITLSQRFRLPFNIFGRATIGYFNYDRYGMDLSFFYPFKDERFSLEGRIGYTGIGYWDSFRLVYDRDMETNWSIGGNFYWPQYNTQFSLKGEKYLLGEKGVKFEMIRHFRYASVGFYAMKAEHANSNGGFKFQVALPFYKMKRSKNKYIPRVNFSPNMGIIYNAGNERKYYREYKAEAGDNIMENNSFNPFFIKSELLIF